MKMRAYLAVILLATISLSQLSFAKEERIHKHKDAFLEYLLKIGKQFDAEGTTYLVSKAYASQGSLNQSMALIPLLNEENNRYALLRHLIKCDSKKELKDFKKIESLVTMLEDRDHKVNICMLLLNEYLKAGHNTKAKRLYEKCHRILETLKTEDEEIYVFLLSDLYFSLCKTGLIKEREVLLKEIEDVIRKTKNIDEKIQIIEYMMHGCIEQYDETNAAKYSQRIKKILDGSNYDLRNLHYEILIQDFISLRRFDDGLELAKKAVDTLGMEEFIMKMGPFMTKPYQFFSHLVSADNSISKNSLERFGSVGIKLFIEVGDLKTAKEIAEAISSKEGPSTNMDTYYYFLGRNFYESPSRVLKLSALNLAYKIKNIGRRIELMTEIALDFRRIAEMGTFLRIMTDVTEMTNGKNFSFGYGKRDLALIWLEAGFPDKSLQLIETIEDKLSHSNDLYKFGTYALIHYNKPLAEKALLKFKYDSFFKGLLLGKIAAWYLIQGEEKKGTKLFRNAFDIMKKNEDRAKAKIQGFEAMDLLPFLVEDYINARIYGKIVDNIDSYGF